MKQYDLENKITLNVHPNVSAVTFQGFESVFENC